MLTPDDLRAAYLALDYIDTELENVDTRPPNWTEKKYTAAFCSACDKCNFLHFHLLLSDYCYHCNTLYYVLH